MVKHNDIVKRNGNLFHVKRMKDGHWSMALLMGGVAITPYHRMAKKKINECYKVVDKEEQINMSKILGE